MKFWQKYIKEIAIIAGVILLTILMMDYNTRLEKLNQLNEKALTVRIKATAAIETQISLQTQIAEANSESVTEREARNNGEIQAGDQRIIPLPATGAPLIDTVLPTPVPERIKKWEVWVALFFGE
ncbi:MAG: hypothetical protein DRI32_01740 [Chloroflexi bacterium]|nr:MAG: hypothetical protein DRI32_01740 [Chloroflexota bacterium]